MCYGKQQLYMLYSISPPVILIHSYFLIFTVYNEHHEFLFHE